MVSNSQNNSEYPSKRVRVREAVEYFSHRIREIRERNGWNVPKQRTSPSKSVSSSNEIDNKSRGAGER